MRSELVCRENTISLENLSYNTRMENFYAKLGITQLFFQVCQSPTTSKPQKIQKLSQLIFQYPWYIVFFKRASLNFENINNYYVIKFETIYLNVMPDLQALFMIHQILQRSERQLWLAVHISTIIADVLEFRRLPIYIKMLNSKYAVIQTAPWCRLKGLGSIHIWRQIFG